MTQPPQYPPQDPYGQQQPQPYGGAHGGVGHGPRFGYNDADDDLAGRWRRLFAAILDGIVLSIVTSILTLPFTGGSWPDREGVSAGIYSAYGVGAVVDFLYFWLMHATRGQTLGKMALGTRVVRADDLDVISYGQAAWRQAFDYLIAIVTCGIGAIVNVAWILWDPRRQALHDKVAKTLVVKVDPTGPNPYIRR